jgi:hypothetical protein
VKDEYGVPPAPPPFNTNVEASSASLRKTLHQYSQRRLCGLIQTSPLPPERDKASWIGVVLAYVARVSVRR